LNQKARLILGRVDFWRVFVPGNPLENPITEPPRTKGEKKDVIWQQDGQNALVGELWWLGGSE
jgi:hypothetical protein